jgi:hypothetical protein
VKQNGRRRINAMTRNYTEEEKKDGVDEEQIRDEYKDKIK